MLIDQSSLLLAIGFSAAALCIALLIGWLTARGESYQLTFSAGIMVIVIGVVFYLRYTVDAALVFGGLSFSSLTLGFAILWGAAYQFRTDRLPHLPLLTAVVVTETPLIMAFAMGYDGMGAGLLDLWVFLFMSAMTWNYWLARKEAPIQIRSLCVVFALTALSFLACAIASLFLKPLYGAGPRPGLSRISTISSPSSGLRGPAPCRWRSTRAGWRAATSAMP